MWPTSTRWLDTAEAGADIELRADAYRNGVLLRSDLPVEPGGARVTIDGGSNIRRTLQLTIADPNLRPVYWTDLLAPAGTELKVFSGFRYPDGTTELVPVGVYRIDELETPFGDLVTVTGVDRSKLIDDDRFLVPTQSLAGNTVIQQITRFIQDFLSTAVVVDTTGDTTVCPRTTWEQDTSPWQACQELATSIGAEVAPDAEGVFKIRYQPDPTDPPVWAAAVGESGIVVAGSEKMGRDGVYNAVVARNDPADGTTPLQVVVKDLNTSSPTYWDGPFGHRPRAYSSPLLTSTGALTLAATTILKRSVAPARTVSAQVIPNAALDYGDVTSLVLPDETVETHMVHAFTLPLGVDDLLSVTFVSSLPAA